MCIFVYILLIMNLLKMCLEETTKLSNILNYAIKSEENYQKMYLVYFIKSFRIVKMHHIVIMKIFKRTTVLEIYLI